MKTQHSHSFSSIHSLGIIPADPEIALANALAAIRRRVACYIDKHLVKMPTFEGETQFFS